MGKKRSTAAENAEGRARIIRDADPVGMMIGISRGMPMPRRDLNGEIVAYDQVDVAVRVAATERLLKRVLPELQSVSIDATGDGVQFVIHSPFPLPGSQRPSLEHQHDPQLVEGSVSFDDLGDGLRRLQDHHEATAAPDGRPRRSRPTTNRNLSKGQTNE